MAQILRGEIRWADLGPAVGHEQAGHRPVLVLSHDVFNARSKQVVAVALTSQSPHVGFPLTFDLARKVSGKPAWVKISQIRTLSVMRIGKRLGRLESADVGRIIEGLNEILGV